MTTRGAGPASVRHEYRNAEAGPQLQALFANRTAMAAGISALLRSTGQTS